MYFVVYETKTYWGIRPEHWTTDHKQGYISRSFALNVGLDLLATIGQNEMKWQDGNTNGGTVETQHCQFNSADECLSFLYKHNVIILNPGLIFET